MFFGIALVLYHVGYFLLKKSVSEKDLTTESFLTSKIYFLGLVVVFLLFNYLQIDQLRLFLPTDLFLQVKKVFFIITPICTIILAIRLLTVFRKVSLRYFSRHKTDFHQSRIDTRLDLMEQPGPYFLCSRRVSKFPEFEQKSSN